MKGLIFALYGVHGSGKTSTAIEISKKYDLEYVEADSVHLPEVSNATAYGRETIFILYSLKGLAKALEGAVNGKSYILDFSPLNSIPYIKYWVGEKDGLERLVRESFSNMIKEYGMKENLINVFFIPKNLKKIRERIINRGRENVREEKDFEYIEYINNAMKELKEELEYMFYAVEVIEGDKIKQERIKDFEEIIEKYSIKRKRKL